MSVQRSLFDNLPDPDESAAARDEALDRVAENAGDWWTIACRHVAGLRGWQGTGEDLRLQLRPVIGEPHSPNAWGALVAHAVRCGWLHRTGERRPMRLVRSHARMTDVYRSL